MGKPMTTNNEGEINNEPVKAGSECYQLSIEKSPNGRYPQSDPTCKRRDEETKARMRFVGMFVRRAHPTDEVTEQGSGGVDEEKLKNALKHVLRHGTRNLQKLEPAQGDSSAS